MGKPKREPPPKKPVVYTPYALMKCKDCGQLGCLIPVPHKDVPF